MPADRLLVTGGAGFIGANFVHYWTQTHAGDRVVVLDALTYAGNLPSIESLRRLETFRFVQGDIRDTALVCKLMREERINRIVHFAAESHVDRSIHGPDAFIQTNVVGTCNLLQAARDVWGDGKGTPDCRFHHVSTDEVYGTLARDDPAFVESTAYDPSSPYAASKAASDHFVRAYHRTYGLRISISNCSNNYGPYHFPEKLIPLMIVNALSGRELPVYGDGSNVRDWLFVEDHCRAIDQILRMDCVGETYNIGGRAETANLDLVRNLCRLLDEAIGASPRLQEHYPDCPAARGSSCAELITFVADRPGHDWRYAIDATKLRKATGFQPGESLVSGLRKTVSWYLQNEAWWRPLLDERYAQWVQQNYKRSERS